MAPPEEKHLSPDALAERMGVPVKTVYAWNHKHSGPRFIKVGKHVRYKLADVIAWEKSRYADDPDAS